MYDMGHTRTPYDGVENEGRGVCVCVVLILVDS